MTSNPESRDLTRELVGERIRDALGSRRPEWLAAEAGMSLSKLNRIMNGSHDASVVEVWRIAKATGVAFASFAGEDQPADQRVAGAVERAESTIRSMQAALGQLLTDLAAARSLAIDEVKIDGAVGKHATKKRSKAVTVPREATS